MLRVDGFEVVRNRIEGCDLGIVVDAAEDGLVQSNQIIAGGAYRTRAIGMVAANGDIRRIRLIGNQGQGFTDGVMIEGQRGQVSEVEISGNRFADGQFGVRSTIGVAGVSVRDNDFRGNRQRDLETGPGVEAAANRHEDTR
jgi:nitrous oxidase accessory protein NosD